MKIEPRHLERISYWLFVAPLIVALSARCLGWIIPGCDLGMYGGKCIIGSVDLNGLLMYLFLMGIYAAVVLGLLLGMPLWFVSWVWLSRRERRSQRDAA
jgi:hypothetical protein